MKKVLSIILLLAMVITMGGCHGAEERNTFAVPEEFDTSRNYEISFWAKNDTNMTQVAIYEKTVADFEALYPNIKVNLRLYTDYGKIYNDVITNIATDTTPNVCITYPDHIATYLMGANSVVPLDTLFADPKYGLGGSEVRFDAPTEKEIVPKFLEECLVNGYHYAIPYMRSTEACYVNKTFVEKLGYTLPETLTWDFVWEVSQAAARKDENGNYLVNGQKTLIPFIYKSTDNMMIQMLRQKNAGYSTPYGEVRLFNDTTKQILCDIRDNVAAGAFDTFKSVGYPANYLNKGQCIFAVDSTAGATWMGSDAPLIDIAEDKLVEFETVVMPIPQYDPENPQMISQGPSLCIFNKEDPQEVLASWLFAQYMLTNEVQIAYSQTEGYAPVTSKAQQSAQYQDYLSRAGQDNDLYYAVKLAATQLLLDNVDNTFVTPVFNGSASLRDAAGDLIEEVRKSTRRKETVDDSYMNSLFSKVTSLRKLDQIQRTDPDTGDVQTGEIIIISGDGSGDKVVGSQIIGGGQAMGPLPKASMALLYTLAGTWILMGVYVVVTYVRKKKEKYRKNY